MQLNMYHAIKRLYAVPDTEGIHINKDGNNPVINHIKATQSG